MRATRIIGEVSLLVLCGSIAWDLADDGFWSRHALFTGLVSSLIVVAVTAAVLNEVIDRRQRERWSVLAQFALFEFVGTESEPLKEHLGRPRLSRVSPATQALWAGRGRVAARQSRRHRPAR